MASESSTDSDDMTLGLFDAPEKTTKAITAAKKKPPTTEEEGKEEEPIKDEKPKEREDELLYEGAISPKETLKSLWGETKSADVTFILKDGTRIRMHKCILAARSDALAAMLYGGMKEAGQEEISLTSDDPTILAGFFKFLYTAEVNLTPENVMEYLHVGNLYHVQELCNACTLYMAGSIEMENVLEILELASRWLQKKLVEKCLVFASMNARKIFGLKSFLATSAAALGFLLDDDRLAASEGEVFTAFEKWCVANDPSPLELDKLAAKVRWGTMDPKFLVTKVKKSKYCPRKYYIDALQQLVKYSLDKDYEVLEKLGTRFRARKGADITAKWLRCGANMKITEGGRMASKSGGGKGWNGTVIGPKAIKNGVTTYFLELTCGTDLGYEMIGITRPGTANLAGANYQKGLGFFFYCANGTVYSGSGGTRTFVSGFSAKANTVTKFEVTVDTKKLEYRLRINGVDRGVAAGTAQGMTKEHTELVIDFYTPTSRMRLVKITTKS